MLAFALLLASASGLSLAPAQTTETVVNLNFKYLEQILRSPEIASKIATTDTLGRKGIYLIPLNNLEWEAFERPNPDTLSLYSFYPEEIWWYRVRHWLEITELREKNNELHLRLKSRQPGQAVVPDYLIYLRFKKTEGGWELQSKRIYDMD